MSPINTRTQGVHHAGLTVPDLAAAQAFFQEALGFRRVGELGGGATRHMMCAMPGGIRLELIAPAAS
jgi:catechol 2,3-dioxygenase-like lactoylglutathione lyase family enzyme